MKKLEVSKTDLKYNLEVIKKKILEKNSNTEIIAVVKANRNGIRFKAICQLFN